MQAAINRTMTGWEWALLLALSVLWGGSFFFVGVAVGALPPLSIVALRVGLAALALWAVLPLLGRRMPRGWGAWTAFADMGLLNNLLPFGLFVWAQGHIASGLAAILNATTPLFTVLVAGLLLADERLSARRLAGVGIGLAGVVAMLGPAALRGLGDTLPAQLACLAAALSYAFAGVFGRRFRRMGIDPVVTACGQVTASAVLLAPLALLVEQPWRLAVPGPEVWAAVGGLALLSTALAYVLYFRILATAGAGNLLLVTVLIPVSAVLLGVLVLGERLRPEHLAGMAVIGLGLAVLDGRPLGRLLRRRSGAGPPPSRRP